MGVGLLCGGDLRAAESKLYSTDGIITFGDGRRSSKSSFYFPAGDFSYSLFWRSTNEATRISIGFTEGTFGHYHDIRPATFWSPDGWTPYPQPTSLWLNRNPDGSAIGQLTLSAFSQNAGGVPSSFTYRFCTLREYPHWVFMRATFEGTFPGVAFKFDSGWTDFVPPNAQGAGRHLYLNGKHYQINGSKPLPADEAFDGFALYATGSAKLDRDLSVLLFDPANADMIKLSSMPSSTLAFLFNIRQAKPATPEAQRRGLVFAMGNMTVGDGKAAAETFFKDGDVRKVRAILRSLDWEHVVIDRSIADGLLAEAERWLSTAPTPAVRERVSAIRATLAAAQAARDYDVYFAMLRELKKISRALAEASLDTLLDSH